MKNTLLTILATAAILFATGCTAFALFKQEVEPTNPAEPPQVIEPSETPQISSIPLVPLIEAEPIEEPDEVPEPEEPEIEEPEEQEPELQLLGEFTITYYCSCKKCCGKWAVNRPVVGGKEIVYTASGAVAEVGVTVAVDPSKIAYGTELYIEGIGYRVAQDCGSAIKGNKIDVYVESHKAAWDAGIHPAQVYLVIEK